MTIRVVNVRGLRTREGRRCVCYVGRAFAGWKGHDLANPFKPKPPEPGLEKWGHEKAAVAECLAKYRVWLAQRVTLESDLAALWEECEYGKKPLGCWCMDSVVGDGQPVCCHAQILAAMLHERFAKAGAA